MTEKNEPIIAIASSLSENYLDGSIPTLQAITYKGEVNQVFLLDTGNQKAILRVNDLSEYERFKKEEWCIQQANANGVPSPKVLALGQDKGVAYTLLEYLDGANGSDIVSTPELWQKLGQYLRRIHDIPTEGFGERIEDITAGSLAGWQKYLNYNITSLTDDDTLIANGTLDADSSKKLKALFEGLAVTDFSFGLSHGDFSLANVILDENSQPHVIDWGSAEAHVVPHHDLGVILDESLDEGSDEFAALLSGYGMTRTEFDAIKDDMLLLQLLEAVDKVRWALDKAPDRLEYQISQMKKFLKKAHLSL